MVQASHHGHECSDIYRAVSKAVNSNPLFNRSPHLRVHSAIDSITKILAKTLHELHIGRSFLLDLYRAQERVDRRRCAKFGLPSLPTRQ